MPFNSVNDIAAAYESGKWWHGHIYKSFSTVGTVAAFNRWYDMSMFEGFPRANPYMGTPFAANALNRNDLVNRNVFPYIGPNLTTEKKYLHSFTLQCSSAATSSFILCDYLMYYPDIAYNGSTNYDFGNTGRFIFDNNVSLPRYTDGNGVYPFVVIMNSGTSQIKTNSIVMSYTNSEGVSNRTASMYTRSDTRHGAILQTSSNDFSQIFGNFTVSPFFRLQEGDRGVRSIQSIYIAGGLLTAVATMKIAIVLCKPLAQGYITNSTTSMEKILLTQTGTLPIIENNACLNYLIFNNTSTVAPFRSVLNCIWG